jgi:hypothetical protein
MLTVSVMATRILPYPRTVVAVVGFSYKPSTVIGNPSLHRPTALCHWPVSVRLVAENDTHVSRVQTENQIDVIVIASVVATVVMLVMVAVRIASMGIMTVAVMTTAIVVMASILVAVFVIITVTVSIVITVITVIGLVVGFASILLIIAVPATIVVPGVRDQW